MKLSKLKYLVFGLGLFVISTSVNALEVKLNKVNEAGDFLDGVSLRIISRNFEDGPLNYEQSTTCSDCENFSIYENELSYVTTTYTTRINLPDGRYTINEIVAPATYERITDDMIFEIEDDKLENCSQNIICDSKTGDITIVNQKANSQPQVSNPTSNPASNPTSNPTSNVISNPNSNKEKVKNPETSDSIITYAVIFTGTLVGLVGICFTKNKES